MDVLADILKTIRLHTSTYFCRDFNTPWGMNIPHSSNGLFHVIVEGECWLKIMNRDEPIHMSEGDIVAFPTGGAHWISDHPDSERRAGREVVDEIIHGKNPFYSPEANESTRQTLLCGAFDYDSSISHPFLRDLPCFIHIHADNSPELGWLRELVKVLSSESKSPSPGSSVIVDRLTEVLFIQILRSHVQRESSVQGEGSSFGYLSALSDVKIGRALNLIHGEEQAEKSVEALANEVALSRSAFTERFNKLVGESPKTYLVNWRMQKAKSKLEQTKLSMHNIAEAAGYASEAAFSKAFKQHFKVTPGSTRKI